MGSFSFPFALIVEEKGATEGGRTPAKEIKVCQVLILWIAHPNFMN